MSGSADITISFLPCVVNFASVTPILQETVIILAVFDEVLINFDHSFVK